MERLATIQSSIDYIEANLKTDISALELADRAGFSLYHYYRLFQSATGMPVMQFILRRRLIHCIYQISRGRKGIDAALDYGFDTYPGFYKAFQREFCCTPSQYIRSGRVRIPCRMDLSKEEHMTVTHKKAAEILKHWNLEKEKISNIYYEGSGERHSRAFFVGSDYVLKFSSDLCELQNHGRLSKNMDSIGLLSAYPLKSAGGDEIVQDGSLYFSLTKRVQGKQILTDSLYAENGTEQAEFIGRIIGQLHQALKGLDITVNDVDQLEIVKNWALPKTREILNLSEEFCRSYLDTFEALYPQLPRQIIHRDPNPGNIIVSGSKWGFIGFDLSERNLRIYDPCYATTAILSESFSASDPEKRAAWLRIYRSLFRGYDSTAHLTQAERDAIPYVILTNQLVCVAWFADQGKYPEILETNKRMTRWLAEHFDDLRISG